MMSRRQFSQTIAAGAAAAAIAGAQSVLADHHEKMPFQISLAQWSLHKALFAKKLDNLDFAAYANREFGINAVEYVNQFFKDKAEDATYLRDMKTRAADAGVTNVLIMCDGEGELGAAHLRDRLKAVENHYKWVAAAKELGCHSIRVNAASSGSYESQMARAADGLRALTEFAEDHEINVIVENHGGLSSNGKWLADTIRMVGHQRCGTLPDFGNFAIDRGANEWYDRYQGVEELMPYAKAVSAKTYDFDPKRPLVTFDGATNKETDYLRMMRIVMNAGYHGHVGIEFEGSGDEVEGIKNSKLLLERTREKLA